MKYIRICLWCSILMWCAAESTLITSQDMSEQNQCWSVISSGEYNCSLTSGTGFIAQQRNILWASLQSCGTDPMTGFERDGYCKTWPQDPANHSVCAVLTDEFLQYSRTQGNDLIAPNPRYQFPWLKAWDRWCLCAARWYEAYRAWVITQIITWATHQDALTVIPLLAK